MNDPMQTLRDSLRTIPLPDLPTNTLRAIVGMAMGVMLDRCLDREALGSRDLNAICRAALTLRELELAGSGADDDTIATLQAAQARRLRLVSSGD